MNAHTPGPWKATYNKKLDWWTIHHTGYCNFGETSTVCHVKDFQPDHKEADARLIAAAPDLYETLIQCRAVLRTVFRETTNPVALSVIETRLKAADAALAKAEGRT